MDGQAIMTVTAAVVTLTQILKWANVAPDKLGPVLVLVLSAIGVAVWGFTQEQLPMRTDAFAYFAGWVTVSAASAGVFGFTRAGAEAITRIGPPATDTPSSGTAGGSRTTGG